MANMFKIPEMQQAYDAAVHGWKTKSTTFFHTDGSECWGSSVAGMFWRGYSNIKVGARFTDRASRETLAYAYWRAGRDCAKSQGETK